MNALEKKSLYKKEVQNLGNISIEIVVKEKSPPFRQEVSCSVIREKEGERGHSYVPFSSLTEIARFKEALDKAEELIRVNICGETEGSAE
jgi:hypothetical protein